MNWKDTLQERWKSATRVFILSGNVYDLFVVDGNTGFLRFYFKNTIMRDSFILYYDISYGLTFGDDTVKTRFFKWLQIYDDVEETNYSRGQMPKDFNTCFNLAKRFFLNLKDTDVNKANVKLNFVVTYAETVFPDSQTGVVSNEEKVSIIRVLSEVGSELFSGEKFRVVLITETLSDISKDLVNSDYVTKIQLDFPDEKERLEFLRTFKCPVESYSNLPIEDIAKRTSGLNLIKMFNMVDNALSCETHIDHDMIAKEKKRIIEEFCGGLVRFIEPDPKLNFGCVGNHDKAKTKLKQLVWLLKKGKEKIMEKGILIPGRVGVGKSFLVRCFASECGLPVMELGEFRSKWVGDTEKQLARILLTIKALGPVIVVVDEADAVFGNREQSGDSGVSSRVFAALAAHIGDSSIRGKELWIAMTSRPDLLPIDMKRQGRFGLCLPLFPALNINETIELFKIVAKTRGIELPKLFVTEYIHNASGFGDNESKGKYLTKEWTGSEAEAIIIRAEEKAFLEERDGNPNLADFIEAIESFVDPLDKNLVKKQNLAAILSCSDLRLLPVEIAKLDRKIVEKEMVEL